GYYAAMIDLLVALLVDLEVAHDGAPAGMPESLTGIPQTPEAIIATMRDLVSRGVFLGAATIVQALALVRVAVSAVSLGARPEVLGLVERLAGALREALESRLLARDPQRHLWEVADLVIAAMVGGLRANILADPRGLDALDDFDCREWLYANGASQRSIDSPFVRGLYDLALAYEDGDAARPRAAAGQGLRGLLRMFFGYRGAMFWRMRAGMGDVVFAPLHELLVRRGVTFRFFHRLTNVGLGADDPAGHGHVASLRFDVQAETLRNRPYQPLVEVAGRPCWPAAPRFEQLKNGRRLEAAGIDFESHWQRHRAGELELKVGEDFDFVVLGVSVGAIPHVAPELLARDPRWQRMVETTGTVATQAFQVWLKEDLAALGWSASACIVSAFEKPFDSWCDMAHVVPEEGWSDPPATAVYFCGVLKDPSQPPSDADSSYPRQRTEEVFAAARDFLSGPARQLWPGAFDAAGFRWSLLADESGPGTPADGPDRFRTQYWRANVNPSDRYVQTLPGSLRHRISPLDMRFDNLTIAGDWTDAGFNSGCTESAIMSGRLAAHALSGLPLLEDIPGYDHP
ncbi:MAG: FAD-dependent oxidoreductase, partial [Thermaurantiacus sp.]